jgi:hypothetical protein
LNSTLTTDHASALQRVCRITRSTRLMRSQEAAREALRQAKVAEPAVKDSPSTATSLAPGSDVVSHSCWWSTGGAVSTRRSPAQRGRAEKKEHRWLRDPELVGEGLPVDLDCLHPSAIEEPSRNQAANTGQPDSEEGQTARLGYGSSNWCHRARKLSASHKR